LKTKVILTGATGMVGEGVLFECLARSDVEKILIVGRHSCGVTDPKLEEVLHNDFIDLSPIAEKFRGYDSCFFCAGVSSVGKKEDEFYRLTYDMTINFAKTFIEQNHGSKLTFCYVSGYATDSTEHGKTMWARVKGKTENALINMFPGSAYMFRPGYMKPTKGQKNILKFYFGWQVFYPIIKFLIPKFTCKLAEVGWAMINCSIKSYSKNILEVKDIINCSK
jgi:uncharacterized protein YbjT (DUF2867 family)